MALGKGRGDGVGWRVMLHKNLRHFACLAAVFCLVPAAWAVAALTAAMLAKDPVGTRLPG